MTAVIERLTAEVRDRIKAHFFELSPRDRALRFCTGLAPTMIEAYVDRIDFGRDAVFGIRDDERELVGVAHVAIESEGAELGLSVLPAHRGRGLGAALFQRAIVYARNRAIRRLAMQCVPSNAAIMHMAHRFGMAVVARAGEADAHLDLPPPSIVSIAWEVVVDAIGRSDRALRTLLRAVREIRAVWA